MNTVIHGNFLGGKQCKFSIAKRFIVPDVDANPLHVIHDTSPGPHYHDLDYQRSVLGTYSRQSNNKGQLRNKRIKVREL